MTQLEIVLNGIEEVRNSGIQCPLENVEPRRCCHFSEKLIDDIVSLLKAQEADIQSLSEKYSDLLDRTLEAQEPMQVGEQIVGFDDVLDFYSCGFCKNAVRKPWNYCPFCGRKVKWND